MTPIEVAYADTPELCSALGLPWRDGGYGVLMCLRPDGSKVTRVTDDPEFVRLMELAGAGDEIELPPGKFPWAKDGWPGES